MRLNKEIAKQVKSEVNLWGYERQAHEVGIMHLGIGAFHRGHQAVYTEKCLQQDGGNWRILGVSLRSNSVKKQLADQDCLYTVVTRDGEQQSYDIVGAIADVMVAPDSPSAVLEAMAAETTKIVSLTITEKGYCHDPASGKLNLSHPDIEHDLDFPRSPKSAIAFLVYALKMRMERDLQPFTAMSCDNLPDNGKLLKGMVLSFAEKVDAELKTWIEDNVTFPCTMVDRIVPATVDADISELRSKLGYEDRGMIKTEPFSQWVIQDNFCNERPRWEKHGVYIVDNVSLYEDMKLRLLNGSHSSIAYLGFLSGYEYVADVMAKPSFKSFIRNLMDTESTPSLIAPEGINLDDYKDELIQRFENSSLMHQTYQIAMDGSQKIPQRLLNTLRFLIKNKRAYKHIAFVLAAWCRFLRAEDKDGQAFEVQDPMAEVLCKIAIQYKDDPIQTVDALFDISAIFGDDLSSNSELKKRVSTYLSDINTLGVEGALQVFYSS